MPPSTLSFFPPQKSGSTFSFFSFFTFLNNSDSFCQLSVVPLNLSNPVECELIYSEKGTRPVLAARVRNVRVGERINKLARGEGEAGPASAASSLT